MNVYRVSEKRRRKIAFFCAILIVLLVIRLNIFVKEVIDIIYILALVSWPVLDLAHLYFSACTPMPPSKSKVRRWYEGVITRISDSLAPTPEPIPIRIR